MGVGRGEIPIVVEFVGGASDGDVEGDEGGFGVEMLIDGDEESDSGVLESVVCPLSVFEFLGEGGVGRIQLPDLIFAVGAGVGIDARADIAIFQTISARSDAILGTGGIGFFYVGFDGEIVYAGDTGIQCGDTYVIQLIGRTVGDVQIFV